VKAKARQHLEVDGFARPPVMPAARPATQVIALFPHNNVDGPYVPSVAGLRVIENRNPHVEIVARNKVLIVFAACLEVTDYDRPRRRYPTLVNF
jgi:hypothetical protein